MRPGENPRFTKGTQFKTCLRLVIFKTCKVGFYSLGCISQINWNKQLFMAHVVLLRAGFRDRTSLQDWWHGSIMYIFAGFPLSWYSMSALLLF